MKGSYKTLAAVGLCICMALGVTACGKGALDGKQTVATVGEKTMTLGEVNFLLRYQQSQTEAMYESMVGAGFYDKDLYGNGTTFGQMMKDTLMSGMQDYYILEEKAADYGVSLTDEEKEKITAAAKAFLKANEDYTKKQMTADQETVERVLTLMTYGSKMEDAIIAEANVTVTDEEASQRGFSYVKIDKTVKDEESGESTPLSEEAIMENRAALEEVASIVAGGSELKVVAEMKKMTVTDGSYSADNTGSYPEEVITALNGLEEGEMSEIVETEDALYLLEVTAEVDAVATEARKNDLKKQKEGQYYNELMTKWREEYPLDVDEDVWSKVVFDRSYDMVKHD